MDTGLDKTSKGLSNFFQGAFSIDIVLLTFHENRIKVLIETKEDESGAYGPGLPGKLILPREDIDEAMDRLMTDLIGRHDFYKKELQAFSALDRHPSGRVVTFAYYGLIPYEKMPENLNEQLTWYDFEDIPALSFDHDLIRNKVWKRFRKGLLRHPVVFEMLPKEFIISSMIHIYEQAFSTKIDGSNFRKQVRESPIVKALDKMRPKTGKTGRPAALYSFDKKAYKVRKDKVQFNF